MGDGRRTPTYRRPRIPGATIFFTVALADRGSDLLVREVARLRDAVRITRAERPFRVDAWVVLPDHLHCVWTLPEGDADFSTRWSAIKARFSRLVHEAGSCRAGFSPPMNPDPPRVWAGRNGGLKPALRIARREVGIWQRRYWEHHIRDEADYAAHVRYCWINPVMHGFVERPADWPHSSIHRDIARGMVEPEWSGIALDGDLGEPPMITRRVYDGALETHRTSGLGRYVHSASFVRRPIA